MNRVLVPIFVLFTLLSTAMPVASKTVESTFSNSEDPVPAVIPDTPVKDSKPSFSSPFQSNTPTEPVKSNPQPLRSPFANPVRIPGFDMFTRRFRSFRPVTFQ